METTDMSWNSTFLSTFWLVFVAELGDKTQLAVVMQMCKYRRAWPVFVAASLALTSVTILGVIGGQALGHWLPENVLQFVAGVAFVVMGMLIWREAQSGSATSESSGSSPGADETTCPLAAENGEQDQAARKWDWKAFSSTLSLLFVAELGDKTQLAVMGLSARQGQPWQVLAGGALALTAVTALGVLGGERLCRWIPQSMLLRISSVAFVAIGVWSMLNIR